MLPDPHRRIGAPWRPESEISLTLRGLAVLGAEEELDVFLTTVRELPKRAGTRRDVRLPGGAWFGASDLGKAACDPGEAAPYVGHVLTVGGPIRVTVKVTPRQSPEWALKNTLSVTLSERGRAAAWDQWRIECGRGYL